MTAQAQPLSLGAQLQGELAQIARFVEGVKALVIGDANGLPVAALARGVQPSAATAMASLLLSAAHRVTTTLELMGSADVTIEGEGWWVIMDEIGEGFTLLTVVAGNVNLGAAKLALRYRLPLLKEILLEMR